MSQTFAPLDITPSSSSSNPRRVSYFYDPDVGNYVYYLGHPMKPHRIRMAHNLIINYGLCDDGEANTDGSRNVNSELTNGYGHGYDPDGERLRTEKAMTGAMGKGMQVFRPKRATTGDMTRFHSDEYIELLEQVTPETSDQLTGNGARCEYPYVQYSRNRASPSRRVLTILGLTGSDCPAFEGVFEFCSISAGGSIGQYLIIDPISLSEVALTPLISRRRG